MGTGWGRRVSGVLAAGALLAVAQVPVAWADEVLAIEPGEITVTNGTGRFIMLNHGASTVDVVVTGIAMRDTVRGPLKFASGTEAATQKLTTPVPGHDSVVVVVSLGDGAPTEGSGVVTLVTDPALAGTHHKVTVTAGSPSALAASGSAELRNVADWPIWPQQEVRFSVPIKEHTCPGDWKGLVVLQSGTDSTTANATCSGDAATRLDIAGGVPPAYGTYTGTIKLGGSDLQLSVTNAAGWIWPILIAAFALLFGLAVRGYLNNRRPISRLISKAKGLQDTAEAADLAVKRAFNDIKYTIKPGAEREAETLSERAQAVLDRYPGLAGWFSHPTADDAAVIDQITKDLTTASSTIDDWRNRAATVLTNLKSTMDKHRDLALRLAPGLDEHAQKVVNPGTEVKPETRDIPGLLADAEATTASLNLLPTVDAVDRALDAREPDRPRYGASHAAWFDESRGLLNEVCDALAKATTGSELAATHVDQSLEQARRLAIRLPHPPTTAISTIDPEMATYDYAPVPDSMRGVLGWFDLIRARLASPSDQLVRSMRTTDRWLLFLAAFVAVWGGLVAWYIDKPWGTWIDVVTALVWGAGASVVAGPLVEAVERVTQNAADRRAQRSLNRAGQA